MARQQESSRTAQAGARVLRAEVARGMTVVVVLHDLTLAARYADEVVVLADGEIVAQGSAERTMTPAVLQRAFGIEALLLTDPDTGRPVVLPRAVATQAR